MNCERKSLKNWMTVNASDVDMSGLTSAGEERLNLSLAPYASRTRRPPMCARCQKETAVPRRKSTGRNRVMTAAKEASLKKCQDAKKAMLDYQRIEKRLGTLRIKQLSEGLEPEDVTEKTKLETEALELLPILSQIQERRKERAQKRKLTMERFTLVEQTEETHPNADDDADLVTDVDHNVTDSKDLDGEDPELEAMFQSLHENATVEMESVSLDHVPARSPSPPVISSLSTAGTGLKRSRARYEGAQIRAHGYEITPKQSQPIPKKVRPRSHALVSKK